VVHVLVDCQDAMGANLVNTVAEEVAPLLAERTGAKVGLRILTNLCDRRKVTVGVRVPADALRSSNHPDGAAVRDGVVAAQRFAELDPYRATTHNKGVMNGVDAVLLACGNDWRAVEAGAHAYAARNGRYEPLTRWWAAEDGALAGELTMPLAASTVGGAARNHRGVALSLRMARMERAADLAAIAGAAGLASNLAALRALSTDGIQRGHMALHARRIAAEVGADGDLVDAVAARLSAERTYRPERAAAILADLRARAG
jgi:hydroxymethylglutaryl-CoA reductase